MVKLPSPRAPTIRRRCRYCLPSDVWTQIMCLFTAKWKCFSPTTKVFQDESRPVVSSAVIPWKCRNWLALGGRLGLSVQMSIANDIKISIICSEMVVFFWKKIKNRFTNKIVWLFYLRTYCYFSNAFWPFGFLLF